MYNKEILEPQFDIHDFIDEYKEREIDIEEGYDIIPEALEYFRNLEIPSEMLAKVTEIERDGGNDIYLQIAPYWSGEDDQFNITDTADVALLPNLKKMSIFRSENGDDSVLEGLKAKGIDAAYF